MTERFPDNFTEQGEQKKWESVSFLIKRLPPENQAEIYEIAQLLNISPGGSDDLLYHILVSLGYHKTMICGVPDEIVRSGVAVEKQLKMVLREFRSVVEDKNAAKQRGVNIAIGSAVLLVLIGMASGWFIKTAYPPALNGFYQSAGHVFSQLSCISSGSYWKCTDKNKNSVFVVAPGAGGQQ